MTKDIYVFYNKNKQIDYIGAKILEKGLPTLLNEKLNISMYSTKYLSNIENYVKSQCDIYLIDIPLTVSKPLSLYNSRIFSINPYWATPETTTRQVSNLTIKTFGYKFGKYNETIRPSIIAMLSQILKRNILVGLFKVNVAFYNIIDNLDTLEYGINPVTPATKAIYDFINTTQAVKVFNHNGSLAVRGSGSLTNHSLPSYYILDYQGFKFLVAREEESYQKSRLLLKDNQVDAIVTIDLKARENSVLKYLVINDKCTIAMQNLIHNLHFELGQSISKTGYATSNLNLSNIIYSLLQSKE